MLMPIFHKNTLQISPRCHLMTLSDFPEVSPTYRSLSRGVMRRFTTVSTQPPEEFLRDVGVSLDQFLYIRDQRVLLIAAERKRHPMTRRGKQSSQLTIEDTLLLTLTSMRHYPTFQQLGQQFGISESSAYKIYDRSRRYLVTRLRVPGHTALLGSGLQAVLLDVTEHPIERPTHRQRAFYSGKKTRHTIKAQLIVGLFSVQILSVACGPGRSHDFTLFKETRTAFASQIEVSADSGYQGIADRHSKRVIPIKKPKGRELTDDERTHNRALARVRIAIEHVNRRCKIFRIVKETYRGKHKHVRLTWNLIAGLVNLRHR